jgi:hypothetical protein
MIWNHYPDIESIRRLRYGGNELIFRKIYITEKRDGSNISLWYDNDEDKSWDTFLNMLDLGDDKDIVDRNIHISSHNLINIGDGHMVKSLVKTTSYKGIVKYLKKSHMLGKDMIAFGELMQVGKTPTQIEPPIETPEWILFDILDTASGKFIPFEELEKISLEYNIKLVNLIETFRPMNMDELNEKIRSLMEWCKKSHKEGIVGKTYFSNPQTMFKEKIMINIPKKEKKITMPLLPSMDDHTKLRALQHAYDEVSKIAEEKGIEPKEAWNDRKITMPIIAKYIRLEANEHGFAEPNAYYLYLNTPIEKIQG